MTIGHVKYLLIGGGLASSSAAAAIRKIDPQADLPNVYYLRSIEDAVRLNHAAEKALAEGLRHDRGRGRACVIGGGVLGVELAATLTQLGLAVELIAPSAPWDKFAGEQTARFLT